MCFSPGGSQLLTASQDHTARLWTVETATCVQVLEGHQDDLFFCAFSYNGDVLLTASKDNTCRVWRRDDHGSDPGPGGRAGGRLGVALAGPSGRGAALSAASADDED